MKTHPYFEDYAKVAHKEANSQDWVEFALANARGWEQQDDGKLRGWAFIPEASKWMRIVTLADAETVFNAFFDKGPSER